MTHLPEAYRDTVFIIEAAPDPLPTSFAIITAHNPLGRKQSPRLNREADLRLRRLLQRSLASPFRATGCSPDQRHAEPGWGAELSFNDAITLGRRFRQLAIWWIENDALHLVDCADPRLEQIDRFSVRIVGPGGTA